MPNIRRALKNLRDRFAGHLFGRLECNLCGARRISFHPLPEIYLQKARSYGWSYRQEDVETLNVQNYTCPSCGAADRDRLIALYLNESLNRRGSSKQKSLLDIAPSKALASWIHRQSHIQYRSADLHMPDVDDRADVTDLRCYPDQHFDYFICSHVLEHIENDSRAMSELLRILKPGGEGIVLVPLIKHLDSTVEDSSATTPEARWRLFGQDDHVRQYARADFVARLEGAGFEVRQYGIEHFGSSAFEKRGITSSSTLYVALRTR